MSLHVIDADGGWDGTDETHEFMIGIDSHATVPLRQPARGT